VKNFCVMPWYSSEVNLATGTESVCCWIQEDISRQDLQHKFLSGQTPDECRECWRCENTGVESRRQMENRFLDFKMDQDIESIAQQAMRGASQINMYQLFLGSTCNSACATCGPNASSLWRSLLKNTVSIRQENQEIHRNFEQFAQGVDWKQAQRFNLVGGEPLLIQQSFRVLEKLLEAGNTRCRVSFVTNGSVAPNEQQIALLKNFSDISCCVSIDGIGTAFEYIRYPLRWDTLVNNLAIYRKIFSEVVVNVTVSNLNYHIKEDIVSWLGSQQLRHFETYVTDPPWFNCEVVPGHELWSKFVEEITMQDSLKQINIQDYLPDVARLIQESTTVQHKML